MMTAWKRVSGGKTCDSQSWICPMRTENYRKWPIGELVPDDDSMEESVRKEDLRLSVKDLSNENRELSDQ